MSFRGMIYVPGFSGLVQGVRKNYLQPTVLVH